MNVDFSPNGYFHFHCAWYYVASALMSLFELIKFVMIFFQGREEK